MTNIVNSPSAVTPSPTYSADMSPMGQPAPLAAASVTDTDSVSRSSSIRSSNAGPPSASQRIRKGLLSRAGSEAEDRGTRSASSSSQLPHTTDDDEDESIISDSGPMPRRFPSQNKGPSNAGATRQTSQSSLTTHWAHPNHTASQSSSAYASGSKSGSGEASEGSSKGGAVNLGRAMSISSVSSVNSTSSLEAAPFREAPRGGVRLGFASRGAHAGTTMDNTHARKDANMSVAEAQTNVATVDAPHPGLSAAPERSKRVPKQSSDAWMYRVGPGMRTLKSRGPMSSHNTVSQDVQMQEEEALATTPSKRSRDALRQKFARGTGRVGSQGSIATHLAPSSQLDLLAPFNPEDSSDEEGSSAAPLRTPLPRSSSYFGSTPHSANSINGAPTHPLLTPVPADFQTSTVTNAPLVVPKFADGTPLLSRLTDQPVDLSTSFPTMQQITLLDEHMDGLHPRAAVAHNARRRSSATQRPVPLRAESSDDAFDRVASPGLKVDDPSAFGAAPAEPALFTLSPSGPASKPAVSSNRQNRPTSISSVIVQRPTPAEVVRMEAQAGIASLPSLPSEPSPVPSGYSSGVSESGANVAPASRDRSDSASTVFNVADSEGAHSPDGPLSPRAKAKRPATLRTRTSERSITRTHDSLVDNASHGDSVAQSALRVSITDHEDEAMPSANGSPAPLTPVASDVNGIPFVALMASSDYAQKRSASPASLLARSPETIHAGTNARIGGFNYGMSPASISNLRSPRMLPVRTSTPVERARASTPVERTRSPSTPRSPVDFHYGETLGEGSYSTVLEAWDLLSGTSPKQPGVVDPDATSAAAAMVGADSRRRKGRQVDLSGRSMYAIKILDKVHILKQGKQKYVTVEREALSRMIRHPGIVTLYWTFQDRESLYFVLELASKGELLGSIREYGSFDEPCARYYAAQLAEAIDAMHKAGVVHRDIKPENILLDAHNRIKVTDFGSAKIVHAPNASVELQTEEQQADQPSQNGTVVNQHRAASFVGTAEYVSPELLVEKAEPAGKPADWWAFGCVVFQMLAGRPPFKGVNEYQTLQKVKHREFAFPSTFPEDALDLIDRLLVLDPAKRLTANAVKAHAFFAGISFDSLWDTEAVLMRTGLAKPAPKQASLPSEFAETSDFSFDDGFVSSADSQAYAGDTQSLNHTERRSGPDEDSSRMQGREDAGSENGDAHSHQVSTERQLSAMSIDMAGRPAQMAEKPANATIDLETRTAASSRPGAVPAGVQSWAALLLPRELMLYSIAVHQKTGAAKMFSKRRQLILTDFPRLLCVKDTAVALKVKSEVILAIHSDIGRNREASFQKVSSGKYGGTEVAEDAIVVNTTDNGGNSRSIASPNLLVGVEYRSGKSFVIRTSAQTYVYEVVSGDAAAIVKQIRDACKAI